MSLSPETLPQLEHTWASARGFPGILSEVNNQPLGKRFMATAFLFFLMGGVLALLMRWQLAVSENTVLGPQVYNELFTMHGSTMMFLFAVPFLEGFALYVLPMMIGARDVAFPRLTAYGYWVYLFGGLIFYASFFFGAVPEVGWFGYTPLSTERFTPGYATDFWLLGLSLVEVAGLTAAVEIIATILKFRAPGMTLARMPILIWTFLVIGLMILIAFSVLLTATVLLELDRSAGTRFFEVEAGGNNLLWQHLFWFFGHPEVYIMFLPAAGIISMIVPVFARRPIVGYTPLVVAVIVTGFVSFGLWVHHMFAAGLPALAMSFFTASSLMIAIASGVQVFAWIATLWGSRPELRPPLLFALGFVFLFVLGGMTGVMVAVVPFDVQVHDTYFVVAHFHYVLIGGVVFPIFAALHYWLPKITGRMLNSALGCWSFWLTFIGFNATFFPMHIMGFLGLPRRVYTYPAQLQLDGYNLLATFGSIILAAGTAAFLANVTWSLRRGRPAGDNPWNADTLEWSIASPPPVFTFLKPPRVDGRHPLWSTNVPAEADVQVDEVRDALEGKPSTWRGTLVTDAVYAQPQAIQYLPGNTYIPFWTALATAICAAGILARAYVLAGAAIAFLAAMIATWLWPDPNAMRLRRHSDLDDRIGLTLFPTGSRATTWWGMLGLISMAASSVGALLYSYFYIRLFSETWPPSPASPPELIFPSVAFGLLVVAAILTRLAMRFYRRVATGRAHFVLGLAQLNGVAFVASQIVYLLQQPFDPTTNAYASLFFLLSAVAMLATMVAVVLSVAAVFRFASEPSRSINSAILQIETAVMFWGFTGVLAIVIYVTIYLSPHILPR